MKWFRDWGWKEPGFEILSYKTKDNQSSQSSLIFFIAMSLLWATSGLDHRKLLDLPPIQVGSHSNPRITVAPCEIHSKHQSSVILPSLQGRRVGLKEFVFESKHDYSVSSPTPEPLLFLLFPSYIGWLKTWCFLTSKRLKLEGQIPWQGGREISLSVKWPACHSIMHFWKQCF